MTLDDLTHVLICTLPERGRALCRPAMIVEAIEQARDPVLANMAQRMAAVDKVAVGADFVNQIQCQGLLADLQLAEISPQPADDLIAEYEEFETTSRGTV